MTDATTQKEDTDLNQSYAQFLNTAVGILVYALIITLSSIVGVWALVLFASCALARVDTIMTLIRVAASNETCLTTAHAHEAPVESACTSVQKLGHPVKELVLRTERFSSNWPTCMAYWFTIDGLLVYILLGLHVMLLLTLA